MGISTPVLVSALNFTINSPADVLTNQEFEVRIVGESSEGYDVKIFVYEEEKNNYVSEIYDGSAWKSPHRYLLNVFPSQTTYTIRVPSFIGETELCARLRRNGQDRYDEQCVRIEVSANPDDSSDEDEDDSHQNDSSDDDSREREEQKSETEGVPKKLSPSFIPIDSDSSIQPVTNASETKEKKKITLSSTKDALLEGKVDEAYLTSEGKIRQTVIYAFAGFCIALTLLIVLKKV